MSPIEHCVYICRVGIPWSIALGSLLICTWEGREENNLIMYHLLLLLFIIYYLVLSQSQYIELCLISFRSYRVNYSLGFQGLQNCIVEVNQAIERLTLVTCYFNLLFL